MALLTYALLALLASASPINRQEDEPAIAVPSTTHDALPNLALANNGQNGGIDRGPPFDPAASLSAITRSAGTQAFTYAPQSSSISSSSIPVFTYAPQTSSSLGSQNGGLPRGGGASPGEGPDPGISGSRDGKCVIQQESRTDAHGKTYYVRVGMDLSASQCKEYCSTAFQDNLAANKGANYGCLSRGDPKWEYALGTQSYAAAECFCNDNFIDKIADEFANHIVPAIEEITCDVFYTAVMSVVQAGLSVLPGVGQAIGAGALFTMNAAQVAYYSFEDEAAAVNGFSAYLEDPFSPTFSMEKTCGNKYLTEDARKIFGSFLTLSNAAGGMGKLGKLPSFEKGKGSKHDMIDYLYDLAGSKRPTRPRPEDRDSASEAKPSSSLQHSANTVEPSKVQTSVPAKATVPDTSDKSHSTSVSDIRPSSGPLTSNSMDTATTTDSEWCNSLGKRAPKSKCAPQVTVTVIRQSVQAVRKNKITKTCSYQKYPQACAHYYSARKHTFTCEDDNARVDQTTVDLWSDQHNTAWNKWKDNSFIFKGADMRDKRQNLTCDRDEWPPAYFVPRNGAHKAAWGQKIRWLPASENRGAAQLWRGFCDKYDGGIQGSPS